MDRFLIVAGAMKAGTTLLYQTLRQHPQIAPAVTKEPNWLVDPAQRAGGLAGYRTLWRNAPASARVGLEASTAYTKLPVRESPVVHARALGLDVHWVYVVRDPVARFESQMLHCLAAGWFTRPAWEELNPGALLIGNYWFQIQPYRCFVDARRLQILSYRAVAADPPGAARSVVEALGLPDAPLRDPGPQNSSALYRNQLLARAWNQLRLGPPVPEDEAARRKPADLARLLAERSGAGGDTLVAGLSTEVERAYRLSDEQKQWLRDWLREDSARFTDTYGVPVWDRAEGAAAA